MKALTSTTTSVTFNSNIPQWKLATWEDYLAYRDDTNTEKIRLFFNNNYLFIEMGNEGINHARVSDLFTLLLGFWFNLRPEQIVESLGRCLLEKSPLRAAAPDLVLYIGVNVPKWEAGEPRRIDLNKWRVPDLVGEVSDTTLATDLDEKKQLYAALQIPEYWVIDIRGKQVLAFRLQENGKYQQCFESIALEGLPILLLEQTLEHLEQGTNISAASWFARSIASLKVE